MRPVPLDDMGVTIPDIYGRTARSITIYEDAESLYIIGQATFLVMRGRGKHITHSSFTEANLMNTFSSL